MGVCFLNLWLVGKVVFLGWWGVSRHSGSNDGIVPAPTVDGRNPEMMTPLQTATNMGSKWCRISSIHCMPLLCKARAGEMGSQLRALLLFGVGKPAFHLLKNTYIYIYTYTHIYIYMYIFVFMNYNKK